MDYSAITIRYTFIKLPFEINITMLVSCYSNEPQITLDMLSARKEINV